MTAKLVALLVAVAASGTPAWAQVAGEGASLESLGSPQGVLSGLGWKGLAAASPPSAAAAADRSGLSFARCALGGSEKCFQALRCGLRADDRAAVTLGKGGRVLVNAAHASESGNFAALKRLAASEARTVIDVLSPADRYHLRTTNRWPSAELVAASSPMGHPDTADGFLGYTFFEHLGRLEPGILYSPGAYTSVVVNAKQKPEALAVSIYHELRHVLLGAFGREAPNAKHSSAGVEAAIAETEKETVANAAGCEG